MLQISNIFNLSRRFCSSISTRKLWRVDERNPFLEIPEAWVTDLNDIEPSKRSIIQLHPGIL